MRIIKLGIISVIVFSLILLAFSSLIPSTVRISRAINIEAPKRSILPLLSNDRMKEWNELADQKKKGAFTFHEGDNITVVQWYFDFKLKWYPWEKFASITFDQQLGPVMERSLNNLKKMVEKSP